jgi:hypothetical protein
MQGAPEGMEPTAGDITFYAPWGNLALFHKGGIYASGLVKLGKLDSGVDALRQRGPLKVNVERIENQQSQ